MHEQILEMAVVVNRLLNPHNHPVSLADQGPQKLGDLPVILELKYRQLRLELGRFLR